MSTEIDVIIIGAGVVGLAIAAEISRANKNVFVFEKNRTFGLETSSRNSEVIHAGMYYPENSLKAKFCVNGNHLLYDLCEKYKVNHKRLGKIIVQLMLPKLNKLRNCTDRVYKTASVTCKCLVKMKSSIWNHMWRLWQAFFRLPPELLILSI